MPQHFTVFFPVGAVKHLQHPVAEPRAGIHRQVLGIELHKQLHGLMTVATAGPGFVRLQQWRAAKLGPCARHGRADSGTPPRAGQGGQLVFDFFG